MKGFPACGSEGRGEVLSAYYYHIMMSLTLPDKGVFHAIDKNSGTIIDERDEALKWQIPDEMLIAIELLIAAIRHPLSQTLFLKLIPDAFDGLDQVAAELLPNLANMYVHRPVYHKHV